MVAAKLQVAPAQQTPGSLTTQERAEATVLQSILSNGLYYIYQRKYGIENEPRFSRFQKWYHRNVWLRFTWVSLQFARFSRRVIGIPTSDGDDKNGDTFYIEHQGFVFEEWQAEQAIERYPAGGWHKLPCMTLLPSETLPDPINHVVQTNGQVHRNGKSTVEFPRLDAIRLIGKLEQTDRVIERLNSQ